MRTSFLLELIAPSLMKLYAKKKVFDVAYVESKNYTVAGYPVQFKFTLVPSDMKWLATFAGELSNAEHYDFSFANVHEGNKDTVNMAIGEGREFTWPPYMACCGSARESQTK